MKTKPAMMCIKLSFQDRKEIKAQAVKFARGNISAWLRRAGKEYVPSRRVYRVLKEDDGNFY